MSKIYKSAEETREIIFSAVDKLVDFIVIFASVCLIGFVITAYFLVIAINRNKKGGK